MIPFLSYTYEPVPTRANRGPISPRRGPNTCIRGRTGGATGRQFAGVGGGGSTRGAPISRRQFSGSGKSRSRLELSQVGVLEDFAVDRHRHALLDLAPEAGIATVELQHHAAESVR